MARCSPWLRYGLLIAILGGAIAAMHGRPAALFAGTLAVNSVPTALALDARAGHAFVLTSAGVIMLDARSGAVLRSITTILNPLEVVVDARTRRAFVVDAVGTVHVLDTDSGSILRTLAINPQGGRELCDVVLVERTYRVFITMGDGFTPSILTVLDARTGSVQRQIPVGRYAHTVAVDEHTGHAFVTNLNDSTVSLVDAGSLRVLRTIRVGTAPQFVAADAQTGHVFVTNGGDTTISMLDARSGAVLRTVAVGASPGSLVVDAHAGRVFVVTDRGTCVLDTRTGSLLRTVAAGTSSSNAVDHNPIDVAVATRKGRAFVINAPAYDRHGTRLGDSVSVLDARSGRVLRRLPVGRSPVALALDEGTNRLFVVNMEGGSPPGMSVTRGAEWGWVPQAARRWLPWLPLPSPDGAIGSVTVLDTARM